MLANALYRLRGSIIDNIVAGRQVLIKDESQVKISLEIKEDEVIANVTLEGPSSGIQGITYTFRLDPLDNEGDIDVAKLAN